jgi:hypothetical protein
MLNAPNVNVNVNVRSAPLRTPQSSASNGRHVLQGKQKWELWRVNRKGDSTDPRGDLC